MGARKKTHKKYIEQVNDIHNGNIIVVGQYEGDKVKLLHKHKPCGYLWYARPGDILNGKGCSQCYFKSITKTHNQYILDIKKIHGEDFIPLEKYVTSRRKILHKHVPCGKEYKIRPDILLAGHGCKYCSYESYKKTNKTYEEEVENFTDGKIKTLEQYQGSHIKILHYCTTCSHKWKTTPSTIRICNGIRCPQCSNQTSQPEIEIKNIIQEVWEKDIESRNRKLISPKEVDIFIPDKNIAIEYCGIYWHSYNKKEISKQKNRHKIKLEECESKNTQLLTIFENEWIDPIKKEIWISILKNKIGLSNKVYARNTTIKELSNGQKKKFLENNHLQGDNPSLINLALFHNNKIVSVMTFGKSRFNSKYQYELLRFSSIKNTVIVGGASKLFKFFVKQHAPKNVISYANRRWSDGNLYEQLNFEFIQNTQPNYFYWYNSLHPLYSRIQFQKHKLNKKLSTFDPTKTESDNMFMNGYRRIWDCGNKVYVYRNKDD